MSSACFVAICAFCGFTFRIGDHWGFGRARQRWDTKAFLSIPLTCVLIIASGYIGSFIVLVPGAQTFESLKDLAVLLCVVLFGYPALIAVVPAYMLSDLIEGVPPGFVLNWAEGYFFWAAFVWMAYQLIGRNPDFRRVQTWRRYGLFVALIMLFDPVMWGFICSEKFTPAISYRNISSALAFTLSVTWLLGPVAFLAALPLGQTVRMVLGGYPRPCQGTRDREQRVDLGIRPWRGAGKRFSGAGTPSNPDIHLRAVHRAGARDGWRHGDRRASNRGRRCAGCWRRGSIRRCPRTSACNWTITLHVRRRRQASSAKTLSTPCCEVRPSAPMAELSSLT